MKLLRYYYMSVFCILLIACFEDKGNYDYTELNVPVIEGIHTQEWYEKFANVDTLRINPKITCRLEESESNWEYEWLLMPIHAGYNKDSVVISEQREGYVIGREKNLVYPVKGKAGQYAGFFLVKNKITGVTYKTDFYLKLRTAIGDGWMILCEEDGKARLDMISYRAEDTNFISRDIWHGSDFPLGKPYRLFYNFNQTKSDRLVWSENGTWGLEGETLWPSQETDLALQFVESPGKVEIAGSCVCMNTTPEREILVTSAGELYMRNYYDIAIGAFFDYPRNKIEGQEVYYRLSDQIGFRPYWAWPTTTAVLFYDMDNRRFLSLENDDEFLSEVSFSSTGNVSFSAKTGKDMVHMEGNMEGYVFAVLVEPGTSEYYCYGMSLQPDCKVFCTHQVKLLPANTDRITHFAFHPLYRLLYYATEQGDVYAFNMNTPNVKAEKIFSFPGEKIAVMKFNYPAPFVRYEGWEKARWNWIYIATNRDELSEHECGVVRMYDVSEITLKPKKKFEFDKFGKIVDMKYRFRGDEAITQ